MQKNFIFLIFIFLVACFPKVEIPAQNPLLEIPYETLNDSFSIRAPKFAHTNDIIKLKINSSSVQDILFRPDYQNIIFIYNKGIWEEVFHTPPECKLGNILLTPNETNQFSLYPSLPNLKETTLLRIYIFGNIVDSEKRVGAYTDIILKP